MGLRRTICETRDAWTDTRTFETSEHPCHSIKKTRGLRIEIQHVQKSRVKKSVKIPCTPAVKHGLWKSENP
jgi:hypothetical protein